MKKEKEVKLKHGKAVLKNEGKWLVVVNELNDGLFFMSPEDLETMYKAFCKPDDIDVSGSYDEVADRVKAATQAKAELAEDERTNKIIVSQEGSL